MQVISERLWLPSVNEAGDSKRLIRSDAGCLDLPPNCDAVQPCSGLSLCCDASILGSASKLGGN